jgi:hypothetical protein
MAHMITRIPIIPCDLTDHQWSTGHPHRRRHKYSLYGDAVDDMFDHSKGGDDAFIAGSASSNVFFGDAGGNMSGHACSGRQ